MIALLIFENILHEKQKARDPPRFHVGCLTVIVPDRCNASAWRPLQKARGPAPFANQQKNGGVQVRGVITGVPFSLLSRNGFAWRGSHSRQPHPSPKSSKSSC
ncbi:MAG: hypothetical protein LBP52_00540 [Burkholderiaceae bacterium]|nr:hypothetical protein [Burkholderiaceae bacterium]